MLVSGTLPYDDVLAKIKTTGREVRSIIRRQNEDSLVLIRVHAGPFRRNPRIDNLLLVVAVPKR